MTVTFHTGQQVVWPRSPHGVAQVEDIRRTRLALLYRRRGRLCRVLVRADRVARIQQAYPMLPGMGDPMDNPLGRGVVRREKAFEVG